MTSYKYKVLSPFITDAKGLLLEEDLIYSNPNTSGLVDIWNEERTYMGAIDLTTLKNCVEYPEEIPPSEE